MKYYEKSSYSILDSVNKKIELFTICLNMSNTFLLYNSKSFVYVSVFNSREPFAVSMPQIFQCFKGLY